MSNALEPLFRKSLEDRWLMHFRTAHPDGDAYDGVIVHIAERFVAMREVSDFEFDGIIVLPKKVIHSVRDREFELCANSILKQNGAIQRLKAPSWITECATMRDLLAALMERSIWPAIETLLKDRSTAFYLGPVESVSWGDTSKAANGKQAERVQV